MTTISQICMMFMNALDSIDFDFVIVLPCENGCNDLKINEEIALKIITDQLRP